MSVTCWRRLAIGAGLLALMGWPGAGRGEGEEKPVEADWVLRGGVLIDGTGAERREGDLAIRGDRIVAVGDFQADPQAEVIDVMGQIVAPGFIDLHSHSDGPILKAATKDNRNYLAQGVTTVVTGNCGSGPIDVAAYFAQVERQGTGTNIIHLIPHGSLRRAVLGNAEVRANADALQRMKVLVQRGMNDGAWGMSTGLIYLPGRYADTAELIELSKVVARHGGLYASHIRNEGSNVLEAIDEAITIGRESGAPVHISHLKASGKANWGLVIPACEQIEAARRNGQIVTADQYPYIASSTQLGAMVVPHWARQGSAADFARIADDPVQGRRLRAEIERGLAERDGGGAIRIARYGPKPDRVGRDLVTIARREGSTPLDVVLDIERHGGAQAISFSMSEKDVRHVMAKPFVATASDGSAHRPGGGDRPHPRAYGTFPRKIRYALEDQTISLEQAIHAGTGLPAEILGLPDRGVLRPGAFADVLVFAPDQFRDTATFDDPTRYATGVRHLFVNGEPVVKDGDYQGKLAGRPLRLTTDGPADLILKVGRIWTGNPSQPWAQALASRNGEIVAIGNEEEVAPFRGPRTRLVVHPEGFAIPGLIDAHGHMTSLGAGAEELDLRGIASPEEVARRVLERIQVRPGDGWILGQNWDQSLWPGKAFPDAAILDTVAPDRPVWLIRVDGHAGWANSEALRRAGVTTETKATADGQILRDAEGRPTGVLIDGAKELVTRVIPEPSRADLARQILKAQDLALRAGLTGVHDAGISDREAEVYRQLDRQGKLKLRIYGMASPPDGREVAYVRTPPIPRKPGRRFEMRAIKLFIDGAMGSRGALMFEPYSDDPGNVGLQLIDAEVLRETTTEALRHGWQVCTHAIGDRGNALVLDAYAAARETVPEAVDPRLRIEHAQVVRKADVARFQELDVIASMQPSHASTDKRWADDRLGSDRVEGAYAWRWFLDAGVPLAFGSDFPVEVANPFWGIYAAVTRQDEQGDPPGGWHPDQRLTMEETLRAFTRGSAFASFDDDRLGTLEIGKRADVTVVDRDLFRVAPEDVLQSDITETIIDGEIVYDAHPGTE